MKRKHPSPQSMGHKSSPLWRTRRRDDHGDQIEKAQAIVSALEAEVEKAGPSRGVRGSEAGQVARRIDPRVHAAPTHGVATLRQFIAAFAKGLRQIGASGLDPIYGRSDWPDLSALPTSTPDRALDDAWRTWVSPASHLALFIEKASGAVRLAPRSDKPAEGEAIIEPAPTDVHRAAAQGFVDRPGIDPLCREALGAALHDPTEGWWPKWQMTIRTQYPACALAWTEHRRQELRALLEKRLEEATGDAATAQHAYNAITGARARRRMESSASRIQVPSGPRSHRERRDLVDIVRAAIGGMSEGELRHIWLPVGALLDALEDAPKG